MKENGQLGEQGRFFASAVRGDDRAMKKKYRREIR